MPEKRKQRDPHPDGERAIDKPGLHTNHNRVDTHRWSDTMCCCCWKRATKKGADGKSYCAEHVQYGG